MASSTCGRLIKLTKMVDLKSSTGRRRSCRALRFISWAVTTSRPFAHCGYCICVTGFGGVDLSCDNHLRWAEYPEVKWCVSVFLFRAYVCSWYCLSKCDRSNRCGSPVESGHGILLLDGLTASQRCSSMKNPMVTPPNSALGTEFWFTYCGSRSGRSTHSNRAQSG